MGKPLKKGKQPSQHVMGSSFASEAGTIALKWFESLDGDIPAKQAAALRNGDLLTVVSAEVDPSTFVDASEFADAYLACELMSKFPDWELGIDRKQVAIQKLIASETACAESNIRLKRLNVNGVADLHTCDAVIWTARKKIERLLGPFSWDHAERHFAFGPGATFGLKSKLGDAYFKYLAKPEATRQCAVLAYTCISRVPAWFNHAVSLTTSSMDEFLALDLASRVKELIAIVPGNRVTTVPKNAKTERVIAIEPTLNGYIQHGIGALIRSRLKRVGVDLDDQSKNQKLALVGSLAGNLATLDLAAASDSVSMELVRQLLPPDWVTAIELSRSPEGVLPDGTRIEWQKVSSMGNGYTFELESLIFWALTSSVQLLHRTIDRRSAIYGDDIVVSCDAVPALIEVLEHCGFKTNARKSFWTGPFRESCGKHYFRGCDVTPIYIREDVSTSARLLWIANQIRRWARLSWGLDGRVQHVYEYVVRRLPPKLRIPSIPDGYGDFALIGDFDEIRPSKCSRGHEGWVGTVHLRFSKSRQFEDVPYFLRQMQRIGAERPSLTALVKEWVEKPKLRKRELVLIEDEGVNTPSSSVRWRSVKISCVQWDNFGPWLGSKESTFSVENT
jgi:hypothetical protein